MERGEEELQLLGIEEEAFNTLLCSSRRDLVRTLTFTLLLPLSFATLVLCLMPGPLVVYKSNLELVLYKSNLVSQRVELVDFPTGNRTLQIITLVSTGFQQLGTTNVVFEFWLLSTAAVMYTAASIYIANGVSFPNPEAVVPRFWKHLAVTLFWFFTVVLAHTTVYMLAFFLVMYSVGFDKYLNSREFLFSSIPILTFFFCVLVYVNLIGYLVHVISALQEQYYSSAATEKTKHVMKEKRTAVLSLVMFYFIFSQGAGLFWHGIAELQRTVPAAFLAGLLSLVIFGMLVTQTEV